MSATRARTGGSGAALFAVLVLGQLGACFGWGATNAVATSPGSEEALAIARRFETGLNRSWDTNSFRLHFVLDAFLSRVAAHWVPVGDLPAEFHECIESLCQGAFQEAWRDADSVRLLRHVQKEDGLHCQFRLVQRSGQLGYWTLLIGRGEGRVGIIDACDHSTVLWLGQIAEGVLLKALTEESWQKELSGPQASGITPQASADLSEFLALACDDNWSQALKVYPRLPPGVQSVKFVRLAYASCLRGVDSKELPDEFAPFLTGSLLQELSELSTAYQQKNVYSLAAATENLKKKNWPDVYLDVMCARVQQYLGALAEAEADAKLAIKADPTLVEAHTLLIELALKSGAYPTLAERLRVMEQACKTDMSSVAEQEKYGDFMRSKPGREWLVSHGKSPGTTGAGLRSNSVETPKLQGISLSKSKPTALIDGRTVEPGDRLPGGYVVQLISNQSVTLLDGGGKATVLRLK